MMIKCQHRKTSSNKPFLVFRAGRNWFEYVPYILHSTHATPTTRISEFARLPPHHCRRYAENRPKTTMSTRKGAGTTRTRKPKHQNTFAFRHNPKSQKTAKILASVNAGLCASCHDKVRARVCVWEREGALLYARFRLLRLVKKGVFP